MDAPVDPTAHRAIRELVARFAAQFPEDALSGLAARLLRDEATRVRWDALVGEVVACAVYNGIPLEKAEEIVLRDATPQPETAL